MSNVKQFIEMYKQGKITEATIIKMAAFKDELLKQAFGPPPPGIKEFLKYLALGLGVGTGTGMLAAGAHALVNKYEANKAEASKEPYFKEMLKIHPDLKTKENQAWQYYETLWHFSPVVATNPFTAGAYVKQAILMHDAAGGPLPDMIQRLVDIQQKHVDALSKKRTPSTTAVGGIGNISTGFIPQFPERISFPETSAN
jgi:hypothetical protein